MIWTSLKRIGIVGLLLGGSLLYSAGQLSAYELEAWVMGSAGSSSFTAGEPGIGRSSGGGYEHCAGFWCVIRGIEDTSAYVQLAPGLNLFGMPVNVPTTPAPYNASALLSNVLIPGETGQVDRYTGTVFGGWPDDGDNFDLSDGEGYLLYLENGKTVRFRGVKDCPTVLDLAAGLNVVTIPCTSDALNAYSLLSQLGPGVIFSIVRFNSASGMFETAAFNGGDIVGTNFSIVRGEAYLVNMNASVPSFSPAQ